MIFRTPKVYIGAGAIAVSMFLMAYIGMIIFMVTMMPKTSSRVPAPDFPIGPIIGFYGLIFCAIFFMRVIMVGVSACAIEEADSGTTSFKTLTSVFQRIFPVVATVFLSQLLIGVGAILCYVPGFYLMGVLSFAPELSLVENLGPIDAIRKSYEMIKQFAWMMALLSFVLALLASAGSMACIIGMAVTMPVQYIVVGLHYREFRGPKLGAQAAYNPPFNVNGP